MGDVTPLHTEQDYHRVRAFLARLAAEPLPGRCWDIRRFDGLCFYRVGDPDCIGGYIDQEGIVVGAVLTEGEGTAHLQLTDGEDSVAEPLIAWAEGNLAGATGPDTFLHVFASETDEVLQWVLSRAGYRRLDGDAEVHLTLSLADPLPRADLDGYTVRPTRVEDAAAIAGLLNAAFRRDHHNASEYLNLREHAPSFRGQLDLVTVSADGALCAYVGVCVDEPSGRAIVEPVCAHPGHAGRGLGRATLLEALTLARQLGCHDAVVSTGAANAARGVYESLGFGRPVVVHPWRREFQRDDP